MKGLIDHIWIAFIAVTAINAVMWWRRGREHIARNPELRQGYKRLVLGFLFWGNIPWVVMGLGMLAGGVASIQDYLKPRELYPWVAAWYVTVLCLWVVWLWWLFRRGGAKALVDHPGLFNIPLSDPKHIKLLACAMIIGGVVGMVMVFTRDMLVHFWETRSEGYTTVFIVYDGFWRVIAMAMMFWAIGVVGLVVAITWIRQLKIPKWWNRKEGTAPGFVLIWSILWLSLTTAGYSYRIFRSYLLVSAYRDGTAQVVEGTVHVLHRQPAGGHTEGDIIEISGTKLVVDYFLVTPAYKHTIANGGVLCEGTLARVWHYDGKILRLDIPR